ncbi:MAG: nickel-responsive transcriptional regulator NikR [Oligoflexia bacterium]|nr:nickel-responsive transcriptional regulator NikR [Oligoflexia bacterium]
MSELIRFSFSVEKELFDEFEQLIEQSEYDNRSEYIRDIIREKILENKKAESKAVVGTISLVYNHHKRDLSKKLTEIQHNFHKEIVATTHIHLNHEMCAEAIIVRGKYNTIKRIANGLGRQKGVVHSSLSIGILE